MGLVPYLMTGMGGSAVSPSSLLQELCLNAMAIMVIQQPHEVAMVSSVLQHVMWLLDCAAEGHLPAELCTASWQVAAAGCVAACTAALANQNLLEIDCDRYVLERRLPDAILERLASPS